MSQRVSVQVSEQDLDLVKYLQSQIEALQKQIRELQKQAKDVDRRMRHFLTGVADRQGIETQDASKSFNFDSDSGVLSGFAKEEPDGEQHNDTE